MTKGGGEKFSNFLIDFKTQEIEKFDPATNIVRKKTASAAPLCQGGEKPFLIYIKVREFEEFETPPIVNRLESASAAPFRRGAGRRSHL